MHFVALIGSLRAKSYNRAIYNAYRGVVGSDAELEEGSFADFPLYDQDLQDQGIPPAVDRLGTQVQRADGIIFFSPEYNYSVPGVLKNALDWLSRLPSKPLAGKSAAIVGASPGRIGTARMQYHLRQIGVFLDLYFMNQPEVMVSQVSTLVDGDGVLHDETTRRFLRRHFDAFLSFVADRQQGQRLHAPAAAPHSRETLPPTS